MINIYIQYNIYIFNIINIINNINIKTLLDSYKNDIIMNIVLK